MDDDSGVEYVGSRPEDELLIGVVLLVLLASASQGAPSLVQLGSEYRDDGGEAWATIEAMLNGIVGLLCRRLSGRFMAGFVRQGCVLCRID